MPYDGFAMRFSTLIMLIVLGVSLASVSQSPVSIETFIGVLRPALPFPSADASGELPATGGGESKWFVVWPTSDKEPRVVIKANPLHPDTQAASATAMREIQEAVIAAERKAQAEYDRAVEQVKRTGTAADISGISLDDEGAAGDRIDAELELTIALEAGALRSFEVASSISPDVTRGTNGVTWVVSVAANTYRPADRVETRQRFRPAETRLLFGRIARPVVTRQRNADRFHVEITPATGAFSVVLRGNDELLKQVVATADWRRLSPGNP